MAAGEAASSTGATAVAPVALVGAARLRLGWVLAGLATAAAAGLAGMVLGPASLAPLDVVRELFGSAPALTELQVAIVEQRRLPRVLLGLLVGATLSLSGAAYQGVFRNPLVDPYLLGAAAGAGLGVTVVIVRLGDGQLTPAFVPIAAFVGAVAAVAMSYVLGATGGRQSTASLVLAGVAVTSFFTAVQTYVQQQNQDTVREVFVWILGRLSTGGWHEVRLLAPYALVSSVVLLAHRRTLDVLAVGDDEAASLGINPHRSRLIIVAAATLGTAAAVSVSGLIAFVGLIVPHTVRLIAGRSNRVVLPLSMLFGGAFLCLTDLLARTLSSPAEIPIGVVTAFLGAPFFIVVLRSSRRMGVAA